jgi:ArsR family transcriptional regulator
MCNYKVMNTMDLIKFYKCFSDETRLKSLLLVKHEQELCVCELTHALQQSQPKISRHLAQLRNAELLLDRRQGQWVYYRVNPDLPDWVQQIMTLTLANNPDYIFDNLAELASMPGRCSRATICC